MGGSSVYLNRVVGDVKDGLEIFYESAVPRAEQLADDGGTLLLARVHGFVGLVLPKLQGEV